MRFLLSLFLVLALSSSAQARTLDEIKKSGTLKIAVDGATPGFNYYEGKKLTGFEVELAGEMGKRLGLKVEWVVQPFNSLLVAVNQDRFDLIATSFAMTPARAAAVDFIKPHYCTGAVIVSKANGPKTAAALKGKVVVVPVGTVYIDHLKALPGIQEVRTVPDETSGLQSLLGGRADAWVTEQFVAIKAVQAHKKEGIDLGEMLQNQENAMVVAKGNTALHTAINKELENLLKDGTYAKLSKKYFERDIRCK